MFYSEIEAEDKYTDKDLYESYMSFQRLINKVAEQDIKITDKATTMKILLAFFKVIWVYEAIYSYLFYDVDTMSPAEKDKEITTRIKNYLKLSIKETQDLNRNVINLRKLRNSIVHTKGSNRVSDKGELDYTCLIKEIINKCNLYRDKENIIIQK